MPFTIPLKSRMTSTRSLNSTQLNSAGFNAEIYVTSFGVSQVFLHQNPLKASGLCQSRQKKQATLIAGNGKQEKVLLISLTGFLSLAMIYNYTSPCLRQEWKRKQRRCYAESWSVG